MNVNTHTLITALERIAGSLRSDADELMAFADQLRQDPTADYTDSALHGNVATLMARTANTSSWVASMEVALHSANELVRGRD